MQLPIMNVSGEVVGQAEGSDVVFGATYNPDLVHQALVYYQANQRQGNSNTLTRAQVSGGGRKPFAQKGTGRARQGSIRSPLLRHGGVVFGPHPRSYRQRMPKRMRRQAIRSVLSTKVTGERFRVVQGLDGVESKTKAFAAVIGALGVTGSALVVTRGQAPEIARGVSNLPRIKAVRADLLNVLDLLRYDMVLMTPDAVAEANELWTETARAPRKVKTEEAA
jgi:large subunit ribosomal protein L4